MIVVHVNMHVYPGHVKQLGGMPVSLGEEELAQQAPLVRAQVAHYLIMTLHTCQPHMDGTAERVDVRFVEAGIRILDRLARLYRLDQPIPPAPDADARPVDAATIVANGLRELESRIRAG
jgi:hypothetical protein